jgi:signal transduction histidine kinase/DNA-binding response OmpR family regulator
MKNENPSIKKNRFESLMTLSLLLAFVLVIATGVLSFVRLNNIIYSVNNSIRPDRRLALVNEIYSNLIQAENNVKTYTLTRDAEDMTRFYEIAETTGGKMDELMQRVKKDQVIYPFIDTLDLLVEAKFTVLDRLLVSQDELLVKKAMDEVLKNVTPEKPPDPDPETQDQLHPVENTDTIAEYKPAKKENFFSRLFGKKKTEEEQPTDTLIPAEPVITQTPEQTDVEMVTVEELGEEVRKAQLKAMAVDKVRRELELDLFRQDRVIMEKIRKLMAELESRETARLKENTRTAEKEASEVKLIMLSFGAASLLLLLLAGAIIFIYIKKNNEYRRIMKQARQDAEALALAKERFLANMSHEIRTPMNIISGYLGQVMQSPLNPEQQDHISIVKKSADHLLQLLNNLLDLSKLQANKLEMLETEFSPAELVRDMQLLFSRAASEKNLQLLTETADSLPATLISDPVRLRQILFNLVGNAIKFTDKGTITIRAFPGNDPGEKQLIVFEVVDTGIGIPADETGHIFGEFEQGTSRIEQKSSGTGLGLAITAKLAELLGGTIIVNSTEGKGSTFRFEIPCTPAISPSQPVTGSGIAGSELLEGLAVLVADDEAYNRSLLKLILGKFNCTVIEAGNGKEAIAAILAGKADIILMDIRMPGMNGPDAAREIRKISNERGLYIPIIALSADKTLVDMADFRQNGFDECLSKPFEERHLLQVIISLIRKNSNSPQYDLQPLRESCQGNEAFFKEMVHMFLESTATGLDEMEELVKQNDLLIAAELSHKISAPCRHVKAEKLYQLIKQIEKELKTDNTGNFALDLLNRAKQEFEMIKRNILSDPALD